MLSLLKRDPRRSLVRVAVFPTFLALAGLLASSDAAAQAGEERSLCPPAPVASAAGGTGERARLKPATGMEQTTLRFGSREPKALDLRANIIGTGPTAGTRVNFDVRGRFRNANGDEISTRQVEVIGCVGPGGQQILAELRVDPGSPTPVRSGAYKAEIVVDDPGFETNSSVPFEVTVLLPDPWYYAVALLGMVVLAAVGVQRLLRRFEHPADQSLRGNRTPPRVWLLRLGTWELLVGFGAGVVATLPAYLAYHGGDPGPTFDMSHSWGFVTTAFAAAFPACAASVTYVRRRQPPTGGQGDEGPAP